MLVWLVGNWGGEGESWVMEGRVGQPVLRDYLRKHLGEGFLGNVDFVDKIYGGNVGEYLFLR